MLELGVSPPADIVAPVRKALISMLVGRVLLAGLLLSPVFRTPAAASDISDDWFARAWRSDEGLPDNNVSGIAQTPDGFLWVATVGGLVRFDGDRFDEFSPLNVGIPVRGIRTLLLDKHDRLWLSMDRGFVVCAERNSAKVFTSVDGLPNNAQAQVFAEDGEGNIWMAYGARRNLAYMKDGQMTVLGEADGVPAAAKAGLRRMLKATSGWRRAATCVFSGTENLKIWRPTRSRVPCGSLPREKAGYGFSSGSKVWKYRGRRRRWRQRVNCPSAFSPPRCWKTAPGRCGSEPPRMGCSAATMPGNGKHAVVASADRMPLRRARGKYLGGHHRRRLGSPPAARVELLGTEEGLPFESVRSVCQDSGGTIWAVTLNGLLAAQPGRNQLDQSLIRALIGRAAMPSLRGQ